MSDEKYNGWSNYATWRIKLELFDDTSIYEGEEATADQLKETAYDFVSNYGEIQGLAMDYASAFLDNVDWYEIAESINADNKEIEDYEEAQQ